MLQDHTLRIQNVQASDAGEYICTAENLVGSVEAVAHLRVECKFVTIGLSTCALAVCFLHLMHLKL